MDPILEYYEIKAVQNKLAKEKIPDNFIKIVQAKSKSEVKKICKKIIIKGHELSEFIIHSKLLDLFWEKKHNEFVSEEDKTSDKDKEKFRKSKDFQKKAKILKKMIAQSDKKKYISVHAFYDTYKIKWHIFYFDFKDIQKINNHHGHPHIHYISYLWGDGFSFDEVWKDFDTRKVSLPKIHIKWER